MAAQDAGETLLMAEIFSPCTSCTQRCSWRLRSLTWVNFCQRSSRAAGGEVYQHRDHHSYLREALSLPHCCQLHLGQPDQRSSGVPAPAPCQLRAGAQHRGVRWRERTKNPDGLAETELGCLVSSSRAAGGNEPEKGMCARVGASAEHTPAES